MTLDLVNMRHFGYLFLTVIELPIAYSQNVNYLYILHNIFHHHGYLFLPNSVHINIFVHLCIYGREKKWDFVPFRHFAYRIYLVRIFFILFIFFFYFLVIFIFFILFIFFFYFLVIFIVIGTVSKVTKLCEVIKIFVL